MKFWIYGLIFVLAFIADLSFSPNHGSPLYVVIRIVKLLSAVAMVMNLPHIPTKTDCKKAAPRITREPLYFFQ